MPMPNTGNQHPAPDRRVAALYSGGLDSAVMVAGLAEVYEEVDPLYIRCGLAWESSETGLLGLFLNQLAHPRVRPPCVLDFPMGDVYGQAWYASGCGIPGYHEADEQWEIAGRNLILLTKAATWCAVHEVGSVALGVLASNPFADATPRFFSIMEEALLCGLQWRTKIERPLANLHKPDVIRLGSHLPLHLTMSCANPNEGRHCGRCGKCRERIEAFAAAGIEDRTVYAARVT